MRVCNSLAINLTSKQNISHHLSIVGSAYYNNPFEGYFPSTIGICRQMGIPPENSTLSLPKIDFLITLAPLTPVVYSNSRDQSNLVTPYI